MKRFAALYEALDRTTSTNAKVAALGAYFRDVPPADAAWALFFLTGRRLKRLLPSAVLHEVAREQTGFPDWLLSECYAAVGDYAETLALLDDGTAPTAAADLSLSSWIQERVLPLRTADRESQKAALRAYAAELTPAEQADREAVAEFRLTGAGYQEIQATKPQTLGYGLEDSPVGLCAWIVEKFDAWTDEPIATAFTFDQLLTNVTTYWVTATATSSARLYYEMRQAAGAAMPRQYLAVPTGIANYRGEITKTPRAWAERRLNITYWSELPRGGHFAAMQVPDLFVPDVREFFRTVR